MASAVVQARAVTYFVSPSGNDSSAGTQSAPFRTFQKSASVLNPGDELKIFEGMYSERLVLTRNGTASQPIKVSALSGRPIIDLNFSDANLIDIRGDYIEVSGLEVREAQQPGQNDGRCVDVNQSSQYIVLRDLRVHACKGHGVHLEGQHVVLENSEVFNTNMAFTTTEQWNGWGSGVKVRVGGENITIRNNRIYQSYGEGIAATRGRDVLIENNTVYDNYSVNIYVTKTRKRSP